jgi:DNA-binding CsgD family transcriptional regulator
MFPDKLVLLEQIHSVIKRNSCSQNFNDKNHLDAHCGIKSFSESSDKIPYYFSEKNEFIRKLEERIKMLEEQDDHLLYFIHFLFENFVELAKDILSPVEPSHDGKSLRLSGSKTNKKNSGHPGDIKNGTPTITSREMDVLNLLVKGLCAKEIANNLFISETTVITHKKRLKEKFNAKNSVELISKALLISR